MTNEQRIEKLEKENNRLVEELVRARAINKGLTDASEMNKKLLTQNDALIRERNELDHVLQEANLDIKRLLKGKPRRIKPFETSVTGALH